MKIIVVGGGAAGLMASAQLSMKGHDVTLIEKNEKVGRKIFITGKGRCNLTNACSKEDFVKNIVTNPKFLLSSISTFTYKEVMDFFTSRGVELEIQRGNRVFPTSLKSSDIIDCLLIANRKAGTNIRFSETVLGIKKNGEIFEVKTTKGTHKSDKVIIATGGLSYPQTGSTGDGYKFASSFGLDVVEQVPALSALTIKEEIPSYLDKFSLNHVTLKVKTKTKTFEEFGDLTFYSYGIAGPIALTISSKINRMNKEDISLSIDLKPAIPVEELNQRIVKDIQSKKFYTVKNLLSSYLPYEFFSWFIKITNIDQTKSVYELTKQERNQIVDSLKNFKLTYNGLDIIERATVTSGGVSVNEINSSTLECKKIPGLYFIGEVLDVDAFTGGFNLQIAFSTAMQLASKF